MVYRKVCGRKFTPKGRRKADDKTAGQLLPAVVAGREEAAGQIFPTPAVSRVKKRCKAVSPVIQCLRIAERLPKFRKSSPPVGAKEAPLRAFSGRNRLLRRIE